VRANVFTLLVFSNPHKVEKDVYSEKADNNPLNNQQRRILCHSESRVKHGHYACVSDHKNTGGVPNGQKGVTRVKQEVVFALFIFF
jgi:hypothetical protein